MSMEHCRNDTDRRRLKYPVPIDPQQITNELVRDRTLVSAVTGWPLTAVAKDSTKSSGSRKVDSDSNESRSFQQQQTMANPSICRWAACTKQLTTSRAPVPGPLLSYTVLTFEKSHIPPHTLASKHSTRKDVSVLCDEEERLEWYVMVGKGKCFSPNCCQKYPHKLRIWTQKSAPKFETFSSYKSVCVH